MQRGGRFFRSTTPERTKTPRPEPDSALTEDALLQRALVGEDSAAYTPGVVRTLGKLVGNRAAQRMIQRAATTVSQFTGGRIVVQRGIAEDIANGHSYGKHVVTQAEFPGVTDRTQFAAIVKGVMDSPDATRNLSGGRIAYWKGDTVVIYNPSAADKGTCFKPTLGKTYFDNLT